MLRLLIFTGAIVLILHGLVHLLGFVAYWPLAELTELPYKTTLLNGRLPIGASGMRVYSVLWLATAVAFAAAAIGLLAKQSWWLPLLGTAVILSLVITALDWNQAWRGAILSLVILIPVLLAVGLRVQPRPFPPYPEPTQALTAVPLPSDLPAPVARYYKTIMGEEVPVVETAVISGRGQLRIKGVTFPARFRFTHIAGQGYRHTIEATLFGYPLMKVNEWYLDGQARLELPVGVIENEPKIDAAANLSLWGEAVWLPSIFITDPRVRWEAVNENTARLIVPFDSAQDRPAGDGEESFTVTFDPQTGLLRTLTALRWKEADSETKLLWTNEVLGWQTFNDVLLPSPATTTWSDEGTPWAVWTIEEIACNVDVDDYIRTEGP
jgi:hypothetical protein